MGTSCAAAAPLSPTAGESLPGPAPATAAAAAAAGCSSCCTSAAGSRTAAAAAAPAVGACEGGRPRAAARLAMRCSAWRTSPRISCSQGVEGSGATGLEACSQVRAQLVAAVSKRVSIGLAGMRPFARLVWPSDQSLATSLRPSAGNPAVLARQSAGPKTTGRKATGPKAPGPKATGPHGNRPQGTQPAPLASRQQKGWDMRLASSAECTRCPVRLWCFFRICGRPGR